MTDLHSAFVAGAQWWLLHIVDHLPVDFDDDNLPADMAQAAESHYPGGQPIPDRLLLGTWAADDPRRAFDAGAEWMEYHGAGCTMWGSDRRLAEVEAERRYPAEA